MESLQRLTELAQQAQDQDSLDRLLHCLGQAEQRYLEGCSPTAKGGEEGGDEGQAGKRQRVETNEMAVNGEAVVMETIKSEAVEVVYPVEIVDGDNAEPDSQS